MHANTPAPPYYAVIFTSIRTDIEAGYEEMAEEMVRLASLQPGYLGHESARNELGLRFPIGRVWRLSKHGKHNPTTKSPKLRPPMPQVTNAHASRAKRRSIWQVGPARWWAWASTTLAPRFPHISRNLS